MNSNTEKTKTNTKTELKIKSSLRKRQNSKINFQCSNRLLNDKHFINQLEKIKELREKI